MIKYLPFKDHHKIKVAFMSHSAELSFKNSFLPYAIKACNKSDPEIRNAETDSCF